MRGMTPEFHRAQAIQCRRIAAEWPGTDSAIRLLALADDNERVADILDELAKINARLPRTRPRLARHALRTQGVSCSRSN